MRNGGPKQGQPVRRVCGGGLLFDTGECRKVVMGMGLRKDDCRPCHSFALAQEAVSRTGKSAMRG